MLPGPRCCLQFPFFSLKITAIQGSEPRADVSRSWEPSAAELLMAFGRDQGRRCKQ